MNKNNRNQRLVVFREIVNRVTGGNQKLFAQQLGVSGALISKILHGQQPVSDGLLAKIEVLAHELPDLKLDDLLQSSKTFGENRFFVPIAKSLLRSAISAPVEQLSGMVLEVSRHLVSPSNYAIATKNAVLMGGAQNELLADDDFLIIDTDVQRLAQMFALHGHWLCVVEHHHRDYNYLGIERRVIKFDPSKNEYDYFDSQTPIACLNATPPSLDNKIPFSLGPRGSTAFQMRSTTKSVLKPVEKHPIYGIVIALWRDYSALARR